MMSINEDRKGIPLAFFLFSAKSGAQATHASYNTEVLHRLVFFWRPYLEARANKLFLPKVFNTDNDTRECQAIVNVWPKIHLLLCKFHLRQSWKNYRMKLFKSGTSNSYFYIEHVHNHIRDLELRYVDYD